MISSREFLQSRAAIWSMALVTALGARATIASSLAEADCVTTVDGTSTTVVCTPDTPPQSPPPESPPPASPPPESPPDQPPSPEQPPSHHPNHPSHHSPHHHHKHRQPHDQDTYQNPFRAVMANGSLKPYRIDEGVDYRGHGKVYAIGPGRLIEATNDSSFFAAEGGQNTVYKLTAGKAKGRSIFVGEACKPRPHLLGHRVTAHTVICRMHGDHFPGIETGWWNPNTDTPMAYPDYTPAGNPDGSKMAYGVNFNQLLVSLGVPGGNTVNAPGRISTNPGRTVGDLRPNWPHWTR